MKKEDLERYLAEGLSLEQIGERVGREKSTISYHLKRHGLKPVGAKYANKGALPKDVLEAMVDNELPLSEMARQLDRNISSVRHWLIKYGLWPLPSGKRRAEARCARELGLKRVEMDCHHHGRTEFILEGGGSYRCMKCRREAVIRWRRNAKLRLVKDAGGRCQLCGFDRIPRRAAVSPPRSAQEELWTRDARPDTVHRGAPQRGCEVHSSVRKLSR